MLNEAWAMWKDIYISGTEEDEKKKKISGPIASRTWSLPFDIVIYYLPYCYGN